MQKHSNYVFYNSKFNCIDNNNKRIKIHHEAIKQPSKLHRFQACTTWMIEHMVCMKVIEHQKDSSGDGKSTSPSIAKAVAV